MFEAYLIAFCFGAAGLVKPLDLGVSTDNCIGLHFDSKLVEQ